jgi:hypothetical protein
LPLSNFAVVAADASIQKFKKTKTELLQHKSNGKKNCAYAIVNSLELHGGTINFQD